MDRGFVLGLLLVGACKAELANGPVDAAVGTPVDSNGFAMSDAAPDGTVPLGPWSAPTKVPGGDSALDEDDVTLSSTRLELFFKRGDGTNSNLYVMTRATPTSAWSAPVALTVLNSTVDEESPRLSADDLTLYFGRNGDIFRSTRTAVGSPWSAGVAVASLNTGAYEKWAAVCSNGYVIVSREVTNRGQDLFEGTLAAGAPTAITQLNSTSTEQGTFLSNDCLRLYFQSNRTGNQFDLYMASRVTTGSAWSNASVLTDFNTATFNEEDPWLASDERTFVFASNSGGNKDLYISTR